MSKEAEWLDRLRRAATVAEGDAEVYRQQMDRARKSMDAELRRRDDLLDAVTDIMEARANVEALLLEVSA